MPDRRRWLVLALLFLASMINFIDRAALSVAAPYITTELNLSPAELGFVFSVFSIGYTFFCFVGGWASDRFGAKRVFLVAALAWSVFSGLTGLVYSLFALIVVRMFFGMAEGPFATASNKIVSGWFPRRQQATAVSIAISGGPLGSALAGPIVGAAVLVFGWRDAFLVVSAVGIVWALVWHFLAADRSPVPADMPIDATVDRHDTSELKPVAHYLLQPRIIATAIAYFSYTYLLFFFLTWFPSYLVKERGLSVEQMSIVAIIPWTVGFIAFLSSGFLSDLIFKRIGDASKARDLVLVPSMIIAGVCVGGAALVEHVNLALFLVSVSVFFMYLSTSSYWATILDTVPGPRVGIVGGIVHMIANTAGILAPLVTGFLVQFTGAFESAFILAGVMSLIGPGGILFARLFQRPSNELGKLEMQQTGN